MELFAHEPAGFKGSLVSVEVDIRRGIPGIDLVGLAAGAVREARERVRVSVNNSGFRFPQDRVLINLAPSDLPKGGAAYDLPIALGILIKAGLLPEPGEPVLALGELTLEGELRPVRAVLPAIIAGISAGIRCFIVPEANLEEAASPGIGAVHSLSSLSNALRIFEDIRSGTCTSVPVDTSLRSEEIPDDDFDDVRGHHFLKRALQVAAAGRHHVLLFGPPGSGKTMAAQRFPSLLPDLDAHESLESAAIRSLSGHTTESFSISHRPPFRAPHHATTLEGMTGGGHILKPGEISQAHHGVLFLDEAAEFRRDVLQALREPIEEGYVSIVRAGQSVKYPARFQLLMAANPCLCGNLGKKGRTCLCSPSELKSYWKKLGGPLLDRLDIRIPLEPVDGLMEKTGAEFSTMHMKSNVANAVAKQEERYSGCGFHRNADLDARHIGKFCNISANLSRDFSIALDRLGLSSRAIHSVLKVALTVSDIDGKEGIDHDSLFEAMQYRRYGELDSFWP